MSMLYFLPAPFNDAEEWSLTLRTNNFNKHHSDHSMHVLLLIQNLSQQVKNIGIWDKGMSLNGNLIFHSCGS
jgi:hypothetical protein